MTTLPYEKRSNFLQVQKEEKAVHYSGCQTEFEFIRVVRIGNYRPVLATNATV